jgi:hypothetical protein
VFSGVKPMKNLSVNCWFTHRKMVRAAAAISSQRQAPGSDRTRVISESSGAACGSSKAGGGLAGVGVKAGPSARVAGSADHSRHRRRGSGRRPPPGMAGRDARVESDPAPAR